MSHLIKLSPDEFVAFLKSEGITKFYFYTAHSVFKSSHPILQPIADILSQTGTDFDHHEALFVEISSDNVLMSAAIHKTCRGSAAGGVRNWSYLGVEEFFRDGLRLSKGMTHKNALAGIWWGGGKGVMARNSGNGLDHGHSKETRKSVYEDYGRFLSRLYGSYISAEDLGTNEQDMAAIFSKTRHTTCIPKEFGGSGNPSVVTAMGVLRGMEAAFAFLGKSLVGATIAVQGCGHVGLPFIKFAFEAGAKRIIASDVDAHRADDIKKEFVGFDFELMIVDRNDPSILFLDVDAIAPCATGGILHATSIPQIKAKIICGAANNQLEEMFTDDKLIHDRNIVYCPDFLVNRMGIVNCADEFTGVIDDDPKLDLHLGKEWDNSIYNLMIDVLKESAKTGMTTQQIAIRTAEEKSNVVNPLYGHRGKQIITWIVSNDKF